MSTLRIDGSMGEGGGQVLRYALALSALLLKPIEIFNIRSKRENPGLRPQHLTAVKAIAELTEAEVEGAFVGSTSLVFKPQRRLCGEFELDIGTAGSVSLVIQAVLPVLLYSECRSRITIKGGTNVPLSPPVDYMVNVFLYNLRRLGISAKIDLIRRGHYPRGGGIVSLEVEPLKEPIQPINAVSRDRLIGLYVKSYCVKLPHHVAQRQALSASQLLRRILGVEPHIDIETYPPEKDPHLGPGSGILVYAEMDSRLRLGADSLGEKGKPAEKVGEEAAVKFIEDFETGMALDRHMGDMIIPYLFLAKGESIVGVSRITMHLLTAIELSRLFIPEAIAEIKGELDKPGLIRITGIGFSS